MRLNDDSRIVIDGTRVTLQILASLTNNYSCIIYNHNMFMGYATGVIIVKYNLQMG
jgi:hypothetical protein